jgi:hypothetical protein
MVAVLKSLSLGKGVLKFLQQKSTQEVIRKLAEGWYNLSAPKYVGQKAGKLIVANPFSPAVKKAVKKVKKG